MSTQVKILSAVGIIFFVCLVVWVVRTTPTTPPPIEKVDPPTVMEYEGNTITEEQDGKIIWELTCDKLRVDTITQNMELDGVKGKFYQYDEEKGDKIWELTAKQGVYFQTEKNVYVEGDVVVTNSDGAELLGDKLEWFADEEKIIATGNVSVDNGEGARLLCDKVDWLAAEEKVIATGNVRIAKDDMRGFGDFAYAENNFKKFGILGHAKVMKGVTEETDPLPEEERPKSRPE